MADGFLAPTGKFYPKTENFHAQTARAILGPDGQTDDPGAFAPRLYFICRIPQTRRTGKSPCRYGLCPRRTGVSGDRRAEGLDCRTYGRAVEKAAVWHQQRRDKLWELLHQQCPHVGAKGVPKKKRVTSGAMHRARRSRSGVMRVRPSGTVRFNEKQKMSENNLVRL